MNINLTLLIQMINFFVAYVLLSKGILGPVLQVIKREKSFKKSLEDHLDSQELALAAQKAEQEKQVQQVKEYFVQHKPEQYIDSKKLQTLQQKPVTINQQKIEDTATEVAEALTDRLTHG